VNLHARLAEGVTLCLGLSAVAAVGAALDGAGYAGHGVLARLKKHCG
jgi:hypothetical protein